MSENEHKEGKFMLGFFLGGLLGALVIFFLGTKEGKKAGKFLENKGRDLVDDLQDRLDELEKKGQELAREGEKIKDQVIETIEDKKDDLTMEAAKKLDSALSHIEQLQDRGRESTAAIRKKLFRNVPKKA